MDSILKTDPIPFILAAYGIAGTLLLGYVALILVRRKKLRLLKTAVSHKEG